MLQVKRFLGTTAGPLQQSEHLDAVPGLKSAGNQFNRVRGPAAGDGDNGNRRIVLQDSRTEDIREKRRKTMPPLEFERRDEISRGS